MKTDEKRGPFPVLKGRIQEANCCLPSVFPSASQVCLVIFVLAPFILPIINANRQSLTEEVQAKMPEQASVDLLMFGIQRFLFQRELLLCPHVKSASGKKKKKMNGDVWEKNIAANFR